ncbi:hypothetical protein QBC37DRAFT_456949 [Rhypophila decipiens]|uniref:GH18 domain-containing protein n=1 Tax=Rhypophila decipiens TaxID=261697 RepID=A0AAN6Y066_9PEZI|nr:hypothetical protein QBC37DRAFT_456949 [Rhypophila decipiens]
MASIRFNIRTSLTSVLYLASFLGAGAADAITTDAPFHSDLYPCPGSCDEFPGPDKWSVYSSAERLAVCNEPVLLTFGTFTTPIGPVRACTAGNDLSAINALSGATVNLLGLPSSDEVTEPARRLSPSSSLFSVYCGRISSPSSSNSSHTITALQQAQDYLADEANCNQTLVYGYYKTALVGVYVGDKMPNRAPVNGLVMEELLDTLAKSDSSPGRHVAQVCGQGRNADHVFGIVVGDARDIDWVRETVQPSVSLLTKLHPPGPYKISPSLRYPNPLSRQPHCRRGPLARIWTATISTDGPFATGSRSFPATAVTPWRRVGIYSREGFPAGNCLRSHVNMTTTMNTLSMITKAGVPAFQVVVGVTSYGRSFKMADPSCIYDDHCTFTGPDSGARPGRCTGEAGYLAQAEIDEIVAQNPNMMRWTDATEAQSAYMIYNSTEWVAYMNDHQKAARSEQYRQLGFGGTTDWAVDLQTFTPRNASTRLNLGDYVHCTNVQYDKIEDIPADKSIKAPCYVIYALETTSRFLASGIDRFKSLVNSQGYDRKFNIFAEVQLERAKGALFAFSSQNGSTYFDCTVAEKVYCCTTCRDGLGHSASECKHCAPLTTTNKDPVCVFDSPWNAENNFEYRNMSQPCPPDYSQRGLGRDQSVWWKLKSSAETGVNASFIGRGGWLLPSYNNEETGYETSCALNPWSSGCVNKHNWFDTLRVLPNYETEDVPNPKTIISDHLDLWQDTIGDINEIVEELRTGRFRMGEETGRIDPRYYPLMVIPMMGMLNSSLNLMEEIMDMADEIAEKKRIEFAMMWVEMIRTVLPFFTPWAALTLSGRLTFARVIKLGITWTGELSSRAAAVYNIIENPELTPAILFGLMAQGALYSVSIGAMLAERASRIDFAALGAFGSIFYVPYQRAILALEIRTLDHYQAP